MRDLCCCHGELDQHVVPALPKEGTDNQQRGVSGWDHPMSTSPTLRGRAVLPPPHPHGCPASQRGGRAATSPCVTRHPLLLPPDKSLITPAFTAGPQRIIQGPHAGRGVSLHVTIILAPPRPARQPLAEVGLYRASCSLQAYKLRTQVPSFNFWSWEPQQEPAGHQHVPQR